MKRKEIIFIMVLLIAVGLFYGITANNKKSSQTVSISIDGDIWKEIPLTENNTYTIETSQGYNIVQIKNHTAAVIEADCPDQLCVQQKSIQNIHEMIVCLPHKMVVEIK